MVVNPMLRQFAAPSILLVAALALFFFGRFWQTGNDEAPKLSINSTLTIGVASSSIIAEVADDQDERARGLSGRARLFAGHGMFFVFPEPGFFAFGMPDMYFAIDIIWISEDRRIVYIVPNATPESYPHIFVPPVPVKYVLEVLSGTAAKEGWKVGDVVQLPVASDQLPE